MKIRTGDFLFLCGFVALSCGAPLAASSPAPIARLSDLDKLDSSAPASAPALSIAKSASADSETTHVITPQVMGAIEDHLKEHILNAFKVEIDQEVQCQGKCLFTIKNVHYTPESSRFKGEVHFDDPLYPSLKISGAVTLMTSVPVPIRVLNAGKMITEEDLMMAEIPLKKLTKSIASTMESLKGTEVRMLPLRPGLPIRITDITRPLHVKKGHMVEARLTTPSMDLKIDALALDNGCDGEVIRVQNTLSEKILRGRVIGPNTIAIERPLSNTYQDRSSL